MELFLVCSQLSIGVSVLCLPWLRWAQPNLPRPIKVNLFFPVIYILATLFVTIVPMYASPVETGKFNGENFLHNITHMTTSKEGTLWSVKSTIKI